jgi:hypothetical protein
MKMVGLKLQTKTESASQPGVLSLYFQAEDGTAANLLVGKQIESLIQVGAVYNISIEDPTATQAATDEPTAGDQSTPQPSDTSAEQAATGGTSTQ